MKFALKSALASLLLLALPLTACAQHPVSPVPYTCPAAGSYTDLNAVGSTNPPTTSGSYTVSGVTAPTCFEAQAYLPSGALYGAASNIVGPQTGGATGKVLLSGSCTAGSGQTCSGIEYVFQSAPAVPGLAPATPTMGAPTSAAVAKPDPRNATAAAANAPKVALSAKGL
jgi:hypothetical protein